MRRICDIWVFVLLVVAAPAVGGDPAPREARSKYLLADLSARQRVDYLAVAGDAFADHLDPLLEHRSRQGYAVGVARMSDVTAKHKTISAFLAHAVKTWRPRPRFLLLVGDVETVPGTVKEMRYRGEGGEKDLLTDFDYARALGGKALLR
ncbi:MAG TPA: C25 family cysteine peptidase, partial [Phycisphaerae bacterium]|nr:C25 family cysteine peptidase [Phycisphaerae bacterium]